MLNAKAARVTRTEQRPKTLFISKSDAAKTKKPTAIAMLVEINAGLVSASDVASAIP